MTREKAKECIESIIDTYQMLEEKQVNSDVPIDEEDIEALEMAISALSAIEDIKAELKRYRTEQDKEKTFHFLRMKMCDDFAEIIDKHISGKENK